MWQLGFCFGWEWWGSGGGQEKVGFAGVGVHPRWGWLELGLPDMEVPEWEGEGVVTRAGGREGER